MSAIRLRIALAVVVWLLLMVALTLFYLWRWLQQDHRVPELYQSFTVEQGESVSAVAFRLYQADIIRWPNVWRLYARFFDPEPIKVGEYALGKRQSPQSLLDLLQSGQVVTYQVTLVEGLTYADYVARLAQAEKLDSLLAGKPVATQMEILGLELTHPEGWFFPDTYQYSAGDTDVQILRRAHQRMESFLNAQWQDRAPDLPYESAYDALIMASVVEKETGVASERAAIAGVFVRRLLAGMRLQTDPTVIYGLGADYTGNLTRAHLRRVTPYNTYRVGGLPPTPIAMPGGAAIRAALHPADGDALYFVARGDGSHQFSATLEEHNAAVARFQRYQRAEDYRSSPAPKAIPQSGDSQ